MTATMTEIEKAKAALEPFAKAAETLDAETAKGLQAPDDTPIEWALYTAEQPTVGDLRRAREALSALQPPSAPAEMGARLNAIADNAEVGRRIEGDVVDIRRAAAMFEAAPTPDAEKDEIAQLKAERDKCRSAHVELMAVYEIELAARTAAEARATELEGQVAALVEGLRDYFAVCDSEPEKDCWDTENGDPEEGAERFASDWSLKEHAARSEAAHENLRALLARIQPALSGQEAGR